MKRLPRPPLLESEVHLACISGTNDPILARAYSNACADISASAANYSERAMAHLLFEFAASDRGNDEQIVIGQLTKGNFTKLYERGMLRSPQGRVHYDKILASAPLGKCPYCHFGHAETLDHFLPKARYPSFSVIPDNLVPACISCNKGKGSNVVTAETEISHPYFEDARIEQEIWLYAEITETSPVTSTYSTAFPAAWPEDLALRVANYFNSFELHKRYAVEAASELVSVSDYLTALPSSGLRMEHLNRVAQLERALSRNGWKAALYAALSSSNWYCDTGFASRNRG